MNQEQKALAQKILNQVENYPESLHMDSWEASCLPDRYNWKTGEAVEGCGTTRCIAGWAVHFASKPGEESYQTRRRIRLANGLAGPTYMYVGAHLLGLDSEQAEKLFLDLDESGAVEYLRRLVDEEG